MKCQYCGRDLSGTDEYRRREHRRLCKNATPEVRYIHSGIRQKEFPKTRARIMAEEIASAKISNEKDLVDIIEQTINTHMKELKGDE